MRETSAWNTHVHEYLHSSSMMSGPIHVVLSLHWSQALNQNSCLKPTTTSQPLLVLCMRKLIKQSSSQKLYLFTRCAYRMWKTSELFSVCFVLQVTENFLVLFFFLFFFVVIWCVLERTSILSQSWNWNRDMFWRDLTIQHLQPLKTLSRFYVTKPNIFL